MVEKVKNQSGPFFTVTASDGSQKKYTVGEANALGIDFSNINDGSKFYTYKGEDGRDLYTQNIDDLPASINLNTETGNIEISAPKEITDSSMFKEIFDEDTLKEYSLAYKLNPEYKVSVTEKNEETGEDEEKELTIPEYVERLNRAINNYMENLRFLHETRQKLIDKYGDKANNLTDEKMAIVTQDPSKSIYLPDSLFNVSSFGNKPNPFKGLKDKRDANGLVSLEEFAKVYNRSNFGRDEMAALLAHLEGHLQGSDWSTEETYIDSDGVEHKNRNSVTEAAKILAFKNYVMTKNPDATWNQQAGDYIESLFTNAAYQVTKIFGNMANLGEMVITRGEGTTIQEGVQSMDDAMEYFNDNNALVWDAVVNAQIWGTIGGIALGTWGAGLPFKALGAGLNSASGALTAKRLAMLAERGAEITLGARLAYGALTAAQKTATAINVAVTAISKVASRNFFTEFTFDTIHDAILYDAAGFRKMLTSLAEESDFNQKAGVALQYWTEQFTDNAKWWGPMGVGKALLKTAGKTTLGKAANLILTKYQNKFEAFVGKKAQSIQDNMAGGSVIKKLEEKLESLGENQKNKRVRLEKKIEIERQNELLRQARENLGKIKLNWDGLKLTEESWNDWKNAMSQIKARENAIDLYRSGVEAETRVMHQAFKNPATGKPTFLYEDLAGANAKASKWYQNLVNMSDKYGLKVAERSLLNQDVIDYMMGSYKYNINNFVANSKSVNAADAQSAAEIVADNVAKIKARLPKEITDYIDEGIKNKVFQQYFKQLNEYGVANRLLTRKQVDQWNSNELWIENGYMPIVVKRNTNGKWISDDDKIETVIEQEMQHYKYKANADEHYVDPELVRTIRYRHFAQAKTNREIWKSYSGFGSNATNITKVSGEETEYAKRTKDSVGQLQGAVDIYSQQVFAEANLEDIIKVKPRKPTANAIIDEDTRDSVVAGMSPSDINDFLKDKKILTRDKPTLSGQVTADNYDEWFKEQSVQVKKFLLNKYSEYGDNLNTEAREIIKGWSDEEWYAYEELLQTVGNMASAASSLGNGDARIYWDIYDKVRDMAVRAPYQDQISVAAIKNAILKDLDEYGLSKSMIENVDVSLDKFAKATNADYPGWDVEGRSGQASEMFKMLDESDPHATAEGSLRDYYRDWKGRELAVIEMPTSAYMDEIGEYGNYTMRQSINADGNVEKYVQRFENGERAPITFILFGEDGKIAGQEGRHRAIAADRAGIEKMPVLIEYRKGTHPEILDKYKDVTDRFVKRADDATNVNARVIEKPYKLVDIKNGKVSDQIRAKLAYRVVEDNYNATPTAGRGGVYYRVQPKGQLDDIHGDPASVTNAAFRGETAYGDSIKLKGDGAYEVGAEGRYLYHKKALSDKSKQRLFFPVKSEDVMEEEEYEAIGKIANHFLSSNNRKITELLEDPDIVKIGDDTLNKMLLADDAMLKRLADNDVRAYAEISGKKVINTVVTIPDGKAKYYPGAFIFPDLDPDLVKNGLKSMSEITGELETRATMSMATWRNHQKKRLQELINSKENLDFLNRIGWNREIGATSLSNRAGDHGWNKRGYERIRMNFRYIDDIKYLQSVELHELSHAAWLRASADTRKAIAQDLFNKMGFKNLTVTQNMACSEDMNELIAHCMDRRFASAKGWNGYRFKDDEFIKKHLDNLAKHAGVKATESFKERAITLVRSFITFVKTKLLGINNAKTFDEYYQGLLRGDFAEDLKKSIKEFPNFSDPDAGKIITTGPTRSVANLPEDLRSISVEGGGDGYDVPVNISKTLSEQTPTEGTPLEEVPDEAPKNILEIPPEAQWLLTGEEPPKAPTKINVKDKSSGKQSIYVNTGEPNNYELFRRALQDGGDDFEAGLERAFALGSEKLAKSSLMNEAARNLKDGKDAFYEGALLTKIKGELRGVLNVDTDAFVDDVYEQAKALVDAYSDQMLKSPATQEALKLLANDANATDDVYRFLVLQELAKEKNLDKAMDAFGKKVEKLFDKKKTKSLKHGDVELMKKKAREILVGVINNEQNVARLAANTISPGLLETNDLFDKVKEINDRINEAEEHLGQDYVMYLDDEGRSVYAQVDPTFASLFNYRYKMEKGEASVVAKVNAVMSRAFRYGTTSVNLSSFGNQLFRDFGNAILVGGSWQTIKANYRNLVDVFGERIVEQIKNFDPSGYEMKQVEKMAESTGKTIEEAAVARELMRGQAMAPSTTERSLYKNFMREAYIHKSDKLLQNAKSQIDTILEKLNPEDLLNGKRENYLRNRVYASSLNDAMKEGYSLEQARVYAMFAMNNVTTNFARQVYHLQAISDSTPYFRAAINGTKSFWRIWSLDPVGVTGRIMGGLIIPTMYLTGMSLGSEENREVYMNIPEYQKENSLVFVVNGQPFSIPIPQELGAVVAPFRQFVEYLHNSNKNDFWELMMNDLLGLSPVDIQGFSSIDMDKMIQDPTVLDRVGRGFARMFSQMAPVPVKTTYMLATGTDPYTGKSLRDKSYMYWNDETESLEVMDYNQNAFAQWFADLFGEWMSPELAEKVVSGVIGTTGSNLLGDFAKLIQEHSGEAMLLNMGSNIVEQTSKPFTIQKYNMVDSIWKRAIQQLTTEKQAILESKKMKALNNELASTKDPEKKKKLLAERQDLVDEFQEKVKDTITRLSTEYDGSLNRSKLAAAITLLNFNSDSAYQSGSQYSIDLSSDLFWDGRDAAVHTLERMGVSGTSDMSIFGYLTVDKETGKPMVKYNSPIAMLDMKSQWDNQDDIHTANIKALLSQNSVYDAHKAVSDQIQKIYGSKSKLTNADRANIEAIQINWNAQLAKIIAPYVAQMTPEAAINNTKVLNALYPYVEVPGSWEVNDKGRFVSLGSRGNKKKAYYESWIKSMFSVNDPYKGQY